MFVSNINLTEVRETAINNAMGAIKEAQTALANAMAIISMNLHELAVLERYLQPSQEAPVEAPEAAPRTKKNNPPRSAHADSEEASYAIYSYVENNPGTTADAIAKYLRSVHAVPKQMQEVSVHGLIHRLVKRLDIHVQRRPSGPKSPSLYSVRKAQQKGHANPRSGTGTVGAIRALAMNLLKRDSHSLKQIHDFAQTQGLRGSPSDRLSNIVGRVMRELHKKGTVQRTEEGSNIIYSLAEKGE